MRVLICWNTAAAFNPIADLLINNGHEVRIVMRSVLDLGDCTRDHVAGVMVGSAIDYYLEVMRQIRKFKPTHIQVSSNSLCLILICLLAPRVPVVLTYHGSDIRGRKRVPRESRLADFIAVSTQDLEKYGTWIDRSICNIFYYRGGRIKNTALMLYSHGFPSDRRELAKEWCSYRNIRLTILDRSQPGHETVAYLDMPKLYSKFEYYLDFKGFVGEQYALSKAAMEAFLCGCTVYHDSDFDLPLQDITAGDPMEYIRLYQSFSRSSILRGIKRFVLAVIFLPKGIWELIKLTKSSRRG